VATARGARHDESANPLEHAAPDVELAEAQLALGRPDLGVLVISHYQRMLEELDADRVHLIVDGAIVAEGGPELAKQLENEGYDAWRR